MTKTIIIRNFNGIPISNANAVGGHSIPNANVTTFDSTSSNNTQNSGLGITIEDLNILYFNFLQPFLNEGPFYMDSNELLAKIYADVTTFIANTIDNTAIMVYQIFQDTITVLMQTRNVYFTNLMLTNEVKTLRDKYQISLDKIVDLTLDLMKCQNEDNGINNAVLSGNMGIVIKQPKQLIYAQAIMNINLAWYYYLYNKSFIDPRLYGATINYVTTMGTKRDAYLKLIGLLDDKYKTLDDNLKAKQLEITT